MKAKLFLFLIFFVIHIVSCKDEAKKTQEHIYEYVDRVKVLDPIDCANISSNINLGIDISEKVIDILFIDNKVVFTTDIVKDYENYFNVVYKYEQPFINVKYLQKVEAISSVEGILLKTKPGKKTFYIGLYVSKKDDKREGLRVRVEHDIYDDKKPAQVVVRDKYNPPYPYCHIE